MTDSPNTSVVRNEDAERYELILDGAQTGEAETDHAVAGFAAFHESETHIAFTHTEIDDAYQGQGLGLRLAEAALADAVARDLTIIPLCPYMARYLERHEIEGARIEWPNRAPRAPQA
ncbi:GNAT family N-acetyltransferase [Demequina lutea]|uniref:Putative GNAT family acetyltransferase n=1 Tax=Demequina lutea TaxID=431489 RepID=A0A7Z0CHN5_9MICO|nr:GNAT family N-acetyltransferase [Demequina lutea]NYI41009.1 putative GNAT family acetyltransferase [Demequina lutea]